MLLYHIRFFLCGKFSALFVNATTKRGSLLRSDPSRSHCEQEVNYKRLEITVKGLSE